MVFSICPLNVQHGSGVKSNLRTFKVGFNLFDQKISWYMLYHCHNTVLQWTEMGETEELWSYIERVRNDHVMAFVGNRVCHKNP